MKKLRLADSTAHGDGPVFSELLPGFVVERGGFSMYPAGERTHPEGRHVHDTPEVFCVVQGSGQVEIDGTHSPFEAGDVICAEPGEDHHLISEGDAPLVLVWMKVKPAS